MGDVMHVKACYARGAQLNDGSPHYTLSKNEFKIDRLCGDLYQLAVYFLYKRVNEYGKGVSNDKLAGVYMQQTLKDYDSSYNLLCCKGNGDEIGVHMELPEYVTSAIVQLRGALNLYRTEMGTTRSEDITINFADNMSALIVQYYAEQWYKAGNRIKYRIQDFYTIFKFALTYSSKKGEATYFDEKSRLNQANNANRYIGYFYAAAKEAGQTDPYSYTWFQWQYAILTCVTAAKTIYLPPDEAETYMRETYPEIVAHYEGTEETTENNEE